MQITTNDGYTIYIRGTGTQVKAKCPNCARIGKTHLDNDLSVNTELGVYNCHKCGWSGSYKNEKRFTNYNVEKVYTRPKPRNATDLTDIHLSYFKDRNISAKTCKRNNIKSVKNDWFLFQYFDGEDLINFKARKRTEKKFMQAPDAKPIMYKLNDIKGQKEIIITEGEFDSLSLEEVGYINSTSVNQGAPNVNDVNVDKKLACIVNCFDVFEEAESIILATDNDENGHRLKRELIKRFGAEKCKTVDFGDCKDANEVLCKKGRNALRNIIINAKDVPIDGVCYANDYSNEILDMFHNGQPKGTTTYFDNIDPHWTWRMSEVNIWTGYNNEGKSMALKQLMLLKSKFDNWKHAVFCPEETPLKEFFTDLIESYVGKSADKDKSYCMSEMELLDALEFINEHFIIIDPKEHILDDILKTASYLIRKHGCKTIMLDPYNQIEHAMRSGEREDLYISRFMAQLKRFAITHDISVNLVAHQVTPDVSVDRDTKEKKDYPEPNLYKIKGGGTFADKADNIITIWRPHRNTDLRDTSVRFISQKIKKQKLTGLPGEAELDFCRKSNRYTVNGISPIERDKNQPMLDLITEHEITYDVMAGFDYDDEVPF